MHHGAGERKHSHGTESVDVRSSAVQEFEKVDDKQRDGRKNPSSNDHIREDGGHVRASAWSFVQHSSIM